MVCGSDMDKIKFYDLENRSHWHMKAGVSIISVINYN